MKLDEPVCLCFHVSRRKIVNFIRIEKPKRPSQLSQCFGAGTGCGWCRDYLERLLDHEIKKSSASASRFSTPENDPDFLEISIERYAQGRSRYVRDGGGTPPPGATPIDEKVE